MDDERLNIVLRSLARTPLPALAEEDLCDQIWQRVGEMREVRDRRRRLLLGFAIISIGLGTGTGTTRTSAHAQTAHAPLADGSELAPSSLLHLTP